MTDSDNDKIISRATPPGFRHVFITLLLIAAVVGYFFGMQPEACGTIGIFAFLLMFKEDVSLYLYPDRVVISNRNYFGRLMAIDNQLSFKDILSFQYKIEKWRPTFTQGAFMTLAGLFLPRTTSGRIIRKPEAIITIEFILDGTTKTESISFQYSGKKYERVLEEISQRALKQKRN